MKSGLSTIIPVCVAVIAFESVGLATDPALTNSTEKLSYSVGMSVGLSIKRGGFEVDPKTVGEAISAVLAGTELRLTEQEMQQTITGYQQELRAKREQERVKLAEKNRAEGEKFFSANKEKPGVKVHQATLADGSSAELQYKVLAEGQGESPRPEDTVTFNYIATTLEGKEIDSTVKRGQPARTPLKPYPVAGVREALQQMKPGAKWQLFIPSTLAFGDAGSGQFVEPGSGIIYEIELISVETPQPLTSDIIKVPSKEELDRGAKIEVIKAEDLKRMQQTNSAAGAK